MSHKKTDLGRSLYKSRFGKSTKIIEYKTKKSMKSVLEESDIQKIFSIGALSDKNFAAIRVINDKDKEGIIDAIGKKVFEDARSEYSKYLSVPRRPKNAKFMTKEELHMEEKEIFLKWRRQLAEIENDKRVKLTPYELNLDFWRQLWRVIERSDVLVQVVDARNPLLFRNADLESYVKEVDVNKVNIVLINKADFLTEKQRQQWAEYFNILNLQVIFWSAKFAEEKRKVDKLANIGESKSESNLSEKSVSETHADSESEKDEKEIISTGHDSDEKNIENSEEIIDSEEAIDSEEIVDDESYVSDAESYTSVESSDSENGDGDLFDMSKIDITTPVVKNSWSIIGVDEIIALFESIKIKTPNEPGKTTVGLVGYPNVGKSSTINAIFGQKKVSVSATPGHTKRFQTLHVTDKLTFCDCPGLVMPSLVHSKSHLMVSGILPIDTIRDYIGPLNIVAEQFPRHTIEMLYGIVLPPISGGKDPNTPPTGRELLSAYSYMHSMMSSKGNPNLDRAARIILKDYVDGKLLYRHPPPSITPADFESAAELPEEKRNKARPKPSGKQSIALVREPTMRMDDNKSGIITRPNIAGRCHVTGATREPEHGQSVNPDKPWRHQNNKRCRHEKMRRVHGQLDQHEFVYH